MGRRGKGGEKRTKPGCRISLRRGAHLTKFEAAAGASCRYPQQSQLLRRAVGQPEQAAEQTCRAPAGTGAKGTGTSQPFPSPRVSCPAGPGTRPDVRQGPAPPARGQPRGRGSAPAALPAPPGRSRGRASSAFGVSPRNRRGRRPDAAAAAAFSEERESGPGACPARQPAGKPPRGAYPPLCTACQPGGRAVHDKGRGRPLPGWGAAPGTRSPAAAAPSRARHPPT